MSSEVGTRFRSWNEEDRSVLNKYWKERSRYADDDEEIGNISLRLGCIAEDYPSKENLEKLESFAETVRESLSHIRSLKDKSRGEKTFSEHNDFLSLYDYYWDMDFLLRDDCVYKAKKAFESSQKKFDNSDKTSLPNHAIRS